MQTDHFVLGDFETNCYVLRKDANACQCVIIDTGLDSKLLLSFLSDNKLDPQAVILTHGHIDHIKGLEQLRSVYPDIEVYIHPDDADMLTKSHKNLSIVLGKPFETLKHDYLLKDGDIFEQAGIILEVFHTPGHTPGGISLYNKQDQCLFSGDTLFENSVGRTDCPGGSTEDLITSIKTKILTLPPQTKIYPGHGRFTTVDSEKTYNPFIQR